VAPNATDRRKISHDGTYGYGQVVFPFGGGAVPPREPQIRPKFGHLTANISKTVSRSVSLA